MFICIFIIILINNTNLHVTYKKNWNILDRKNTFAKMIFQELVQNTYSKPNKKSSKLKTLRKYLKKRKVSLQKI